MTLRAILPAFVAAALTSAAAAQVRVAPPDERFEPNRAAEEIGIDQRLGERLPLELGFRDEQGESVQLGDYFGERPVVMALVYYECSMLCTEVLNGAVRCLRVLSLDIGEDFDFVVVSIDPGETPELAAQKKEQYLRALERPEAAPGWHFLTGDQAAIDEIAEAVGFRYTYYESIDEYGHASAVMVATPEGVLSHYFYGVEYSPKDVRLAVVESAEGKVGSLVDKFLLLCFHYDPATGKYGFAIMGALRAAGVLTVLALVGFMIRSLRRERRAALTAERAT